MKPLGIVALLAIACAGWSTTRNGDASLNEGETTSASIAGVVLPIVWGSPEIVADDIVSEDFQLPLAITVSPTQGLVVCWTAGKEHQYGVWVAERIGDKWTKTRVGLARATLPPTPTLAFDPVGRLVVAWTVAWDQVGATCYAIKETVDNKWTEPKSIHAKMCGDVCLSSGSQALTAAYVREVDKFSARKLIGDFVHDPPVQPYGKVAIGVLRGESWKEGLVVETDDLMECDQPRLRGDHLLYFRDGLLGNISPRRDLVYVNLRLPKRVESIADYDDLEGNPNEADLAVEKGNPIVAFRAKGGIRVRERKAETWEAPVLVIRDGDAEQPSVAAGHGDVHVAAVGRNSNDVFCVTRRDGTWGEPQRVVSAQTAAVQMFQGKPIFVCCDGLPKKGPHGWVGANPVAYTRRLFVVFTKDALVRRPL
jgi:hypothetical protein